MEPFHIRDAQEKFEILDKRDSYLRRFPHKSKYAPGVRATCMDMCPEKERYLRQTRQQVSPFELKCITSSSISSSTLLQNKKDWRILDHYKAIKEYSRSAADQDEPLPSELRPFPVLRLTMDYLISEVIGNPRVLIDPTKHADYYNFIWSRTRAIRKDMTQQQDGSGEGEDVYILERCARWHIFCSYFFCQADPNSFDARLNDEHLVKCLQTLKQSYYDVRCRLAKIKSSLRANPVTKHEPEFQAYLVLTNLDARQGDIVTHLASLPFSVYESPAMRFAFRIFEAYGNGDYVRFFTLLRPKDSSQIPDFITLCLLHRYFYRVRASAVSKMINAYRGYPSLQYNHATINSDNLRLFSLSWFSRLLFFGDIDHAKAFLDTFPFAGSDDNSLLSYDDSLDNVVLLPRTCYNNIRDERQTTVQNARENYLDSFILPENKLSLVAYFVQGSDPFDIKALREYVPTFSFDRKTGDYTGYPPLEEFYYGANMSTGNNGKYGSSPEHWKENDPFESDNVLSSPKSISGDFHTFNANGTELAKIHRFDAGQSLLETPAKSDKMERNMIIEVISQNIVAKLLTQIPRSVLYDYARALIDVRRTFSKASKLICAKFLNGFIRETIIENHGIVISSISKQPHLKEELKNSLAIHLYRSLLINAVCVLINVISRDTLKSLQVGPEKISRTPSLVGKIIKVADSLNLRNRKRLGSKLSTVSSNSNSNDDDTFDLFKSKREKYVKQLYFKKWVEKHRQNKLLANILERFPSSPTRAAPRRNMILPSVYIPVTNLKIDDYYNEAAIDRNAHAATLAECSTDKCYAEVVNDDVRLSPTLDSRDVYYKITLFIPFNDMAIEMYCSRYLFPFFSVDARVFYMDRDNKYPFNYNGLISSIVTDQRGIKTLLRVNYIVSFVGLHCVDNEDSRPIIKSTLTQTNSAFIFLAPARRPCRDHFEIFTKFFLKNANENVKKSHENPKIYLKNILDSNALILILDDLDHRLVNGKSKVTDNSNYDFIEKASNFDNLIKNCLVNVIKSSSVRADLNHYSIIRSLDPGLQNLKIGLIQSFRKCLNTQLDDDLGLRISKKLRADNLIEYIYDKISRTPFKELISICDEYNFISNNDLCGPQDKPTYAWHPSDFISYFNASLLPSLTNIIETLVISPDIKAFQWPPLDFKHHPRFSSHSIINIETFNNQANLAIRNIIREFTLPTITDYLMTSSARNFNEFANNVKNYTSEILSGDVIRTVLETHNGEFPREWHHVFFSIFEGVILKMKRRIQTEELAFYAAFDLDHGLDHEINIPPFPLPRKQVRIYQDYYGDARGKSPSLGFLPAHKSYNYGSKKRIKVLNHDSKKCPNKKMPKKSLRPFFNNLNERLYSLNFEFLNYQLDVLPNSSTKL
ncbi:unnamed protein product [Gordionus sp. m RMFG-2023]|uniref:uncharacterized protein LOC135927020 n=1 Tax=Gordionus sp. m RMFG-2023 TaxID=3053472 RepID=UPI0030E2BE3A